MTRHTIRTVIIVAALVGVAAGAFGGTPISET